MEHRKSWLIPTFGDWNYGDEMPITQYFESARQAGLVRAGFSGGGCDEDLFNVPIAMPVKLAYQDGFSRRKVKKGNISGGMVKDQKQKKQGNVSGNVPGPRRKPLVAPKAVDEDLYKIPPELLYQKPKKKRLLRNLITGCLGLNCIA